MRTHKAHRQGKARQEGRKPMEMTAFKYQFIQVNRISIKYARPHHIVELMKSGIFE